MTIGKIAFKNIKGNLNKYIMYFISNVIVVSIFFIFANFILNTEIHSSQGDARKIANILMYLCEFVIMLFTLVFANYSISNFLKSREKEFGLLSMFGLTKTQIRAYVMFENIIISITSILTGLFFGILFSKLFYMAIDAILVLDSSLPFSISTKAIIITIISFFILFILIGFKQSLKIKNRNIAQLLKGSRVAKPLPKFSKFKAILSIVLIVLAYVVALKSGMYIIWTMTPILLVVILGTYLLFTQFSVFFTNILQKNKLLYYKGINMISLSQIIYKLKDNAKVMFITSILCGITLASSISVYSLQKFMQTSLETNCPNDISFIEQGINSHKVIEPQKVQDVFEKYGFGLTYKNKIQIIKGNNTEAVQSNNKNSYEKINLKDFYVISENSNNELAKQYKIKSYELKKGEAILYTYDLENTSFMGIEKKDAFKNFSNISLNIKGSLHKWNIKERIKGGVINADTDYTNMLVISNEDFKTLSKTIPDKDKYMYYGYNIKNSYKASSAVTEIKNLVTKGEENFFTERVISSAAMTQFISLFLFIGTFVAIIFFIAMGSILYFKMFNEIQKDKYEFIALKKLGLAQEEIKKIVSSQSFIVFFLPFIIATCHAAFAVSSLGLMSIKYFTTIAVIYLLLQCIFYLFAKWMYMKQISNLN